MYVQIHIYIYVYVCLNYQSIINMLKLPQNIKCNNFVYNGTLEYIFFGNELRKGAVY